MRRARVPQVEKQVQHITEFDQAEKVIPHGQVSKRLYEEMFRRREFDCYGRMMGYQKTQPYRKHMELSYHAAKLGVEYTQILDMTLEDDNLVCES